jgi:integrase
MGRSLSEHLDRYLTSRRALGFKLEDCGRCLSDLVGFLDEKGELSVRSETAIAWASTAGTDGQVARRLECVRGFARYLSSFDPTTEAPPHRFGPSLPIRRAPHIYAEGEVEALMSAALSLRPKVWGVTMATAVGLMDCTGIRPGEAWRLDREDLDLGAGSLTIWHSKNGRSRRLPLDESALEVLDGYDDVARKAYPVTTWAMFPAAGGERVTSPVAGSAFREVRQRAGISWEPGQRPPTLGDLRHTFAVSVLLSWHRGGEDVQRRLPVLSAYMGHINPADTYWYLSATPELMALVAERLQESWEEDR